MRLSRRTFLKIGSALSAGAALRSVPVLGQNYSVLVPPDPRLYVAGVTRAPARITVTTVARFIPEVWSLDAMQDLSFAKIILPRVAQR